MTKCGLGMLLADVAKLADSTRFAMDSEGYTFLSGAARLLAVASELYGSRLVDAATGMLRDGDVDTPLARLLIGVVLRAADSRQRRFENQLAAREAGWKTLMAGGLDAARRSMLTDVSAAVLAEKMTEPTRLMDALERATLSSRADVVITALRASERIGTPRSLGLCLSVSEHARNPMVRTRALLSSARLSLLDRGVQEEFVTKSADRQLATAVRLNCFEAALIGGGHRDLPGIVEALEDSDPASPGLVNAALDSRIAAAVPAIEKQIGRLSIDTLPDATLRRCARNMSLKHEIWSHARDLSTANAHVLFEAASVRGLVVHRNSPWSAAWIGHAGIMISENTVLHCTTERDPHAVGQDSFEDWRAGYECWGYRRDATHNVDLEKAISRALEIASWRTEYDGTHNNQKGEWFKGWMCGPEYWEADCVGFTEHCYEYAGGNPTPDEFETGAGWPLTPREQRDHMELVREC